MTKRIASFSCCDDRRKAAVRAQSVLNGIDRLEVLDADAPTPADRQRILRIYFINAPAPAGITAEQVSITGGERITDIEVTTVAYDGDVLVVTVAQPGDFSRYVFALVQGLGSEVSLSGLDPLLSRIDFSFKVECPTDLDCLADSPCPPEEIEEPEIDYLAKDYSSFRRVMLDRLSQLLPPPLELNPADLGVTIVEALAYAADNLSYTQDAIGAEAYLGTARRRISVRRHARLVDYGMHEGCNARVWVRIEVSGDVTLPISTQLLTRIGDAPVRIPPPPERAYSEALKSGAEVFETMHAAALTADLNELRFYTWGARECCLPRGATQATLLGDHPALQVGAVLIFEEKLGPRTGRPEDTDPSHRQAVRLTSVSAAQDPLGGRFLDPPTNAAVNITELRWDDADALLFPLCISAISSEEHGGLYLEPVSTAHGNVVLADHGRTIAAEELGTVPAPTLSRAPEISADGCAIPHAAPILPRYRPYLSSGPVTHAAVLSLTQTIGGFVEVVTVAFDPNAPASEATNWSMDQVLPQISLESSGALAGPWKITSDLLGSDEFAFHFVAELDDEALAMLRFGDGSYGVRPPAGTKFSATYRIGNGTGGNVGANTIAHYVGADPAIVRVINVMAAAGGVDREAVEHARIAAPQAFRTQQRAVSTDDWEEVSEKREDVQRAHAEFRWTGSWHTVFDALDRVNAAQVDETFEAEMRDYLEEYRVVGNDLEVEGPIYVPLLLELLVCVKPTYFRNDVKRAIYEIFHSRIGRDGKRGLFHADNFTFGEPLYASVFIAAAQAIEGVEHVELKKLERRLTPTDEAITTGKLSFGRLEIPRLDDDRDFPERGVFSPIIKGGK